MNWTLKKIRDIKLNPANPRTIQKDKGQKRVESIKSVPRMLEIRPIVLNADDIVLGGNMRLQACMEAGLTEVPVIKAADLSPEEQRMFIIKDNVGFGQWDWDLLANEWDVDELSDWGLDLWNQTDAEDLERFFEEKVETDEEDKSKLVLEYTQEDYDHLSSILSKMSGSKEDIIYRLLTNDNTDNS